MSPRLSQPREPIAHTRNDLGAYHDLREHLTSVARLAGKFAGKFGATELGHWAGIWHDLGKCHPEFQQYLLDAEAGSRRPGPDHKAAGVRMAAQYCEALAAPLQGHHGGMRDLAELKAWVREHITQERNTQAIQAARQLIEELEPATPLTLPDRITTRLQAEVFVRMLFSALVDADFLDTEQHFDSDRHAVRGGYPALTQLWDELQADQERLRDEADGEVNRVRHQVYIDCLRAAEQAPGLFRLTVPTGGGKTRSGLAFALRHATLHGHDRIIVAVPYTSITDQTAAAYRQIFSDQRAVLEHHSAAEWQSRPADEGSPEETWARLASENWDAPLIVTTTVQLFESLFARSTSKCRKLHNIARSVIILDEAQTLPEGLLRPTLDMLNELVRSYGVTVVLSTATQPALDQLEGFGGLVGVREIVPEPARLFEALRRVEYTWEDEPRSWDEVAEMVRANRQAMAIVNTRADAIALVEALDGAEPLHLSTLLCGAHRQDVLAEVRRRLEAGEPCLLIATQVVEAGVDIDFPVVLRAFGPLDRIVQAAGRCNREGKLERGRVIIFRAEEGSSPPGAYRTGIGVAELLFAHGETDLHDPALYRRYFELLYQRVNPDEKQIQAERESLNYEAVARKYRLIEDDGVAVIVRYQEQLPDGTPVDTLISDLMNGRGNPRELWRRIQPFLLAVRRREIERLEREALVAPVTESLYQWTGAYDPVLGIGRSERDPDALVL